MASKRYKHIIIQQKPESMTFISTRSGRGNRRIPSRDRIPHSKYLKKRFDQAWHTAEQDQAVFHVERHGVYLEFKSDPDADLVTKSLEDLKSKRVRLLNIRAVTSTILNKRTNKKEESITTYATVFVANEKKNFFLKKIEEYATKETASGSPKNADLINSIASIRKALAIESFWQGELDQIPKQAPEWCEVWISSDSKEVLQRFKKQLQDLEIEFKDGVIQFPERTVIIVFTTQTQLEQLTLHSDDIAEYRPAKSTAQFWTQLQNKDQADWVIGLLGRTDYVPEALVAVCILDSGVNNGHPLLSPILAAADCQAVNPQWGTHDHEQHGHGTMMAGVVAYGDLTQALSSSGRIIVRHRLESVKIVPSGESQTTRHLWGDVTAQGIALAEIQTPNNKKVYCLAIAADDTRDRGRPSSWSGQLDQLIAGTEDETQRLLLACAGNANSDSWSDYPNSLLTDSIHDPAQSWNAITVGAYTSLVEILNKEYRGYTPVAPKDGLSPFSTTSISWEDNKWPIKPEIVLEGGNLGRDANGFHTECDDLSLLSTSHNILEGAFCGFNMTSAATAQASWMAAKIQSLYPDFWPETIRALLVHSAEWPEKLWEQFAENGTKTALKKLLRICGYGVPNLERALYSASNSLTLVSQSSIQPFEAKRDSKGRLSGYKTKDMQLHDLPWPKKY